MLFSLFSIHNTIQSTFAALQFTREQKYVPLHKQKKEIQRKGQRRIGKYRTDVSRFILIGNIKAAYLVPY